MRFRLATAIAVLAPLLGAACGDDGAERPPLFMDSGAASNRDAGSAAGDASSDVDGAPPLDAGGALDAGGPRDAGGALDAGGPRDAASAPLIAYASGYGPQILTFAVDPTRGELNPLQSLTAFGTSPSFLAHDPAMTALYAVDENDQGRVGAYAIDPATGLLRFRGATSSSGKGPAHVSVDATGKFVLVANYGDGTVAVLPVRADGTLGPPTDTRAVGAEAHMIVTDPSNAFVFVPCKGADYVAQFRFDATRGTLTANAPARVATAAGAGPRHLAFHPNGRFAYLINETSSTLTTYALDPAQGTLRALATTSTLPAGFSGTSTAAEVQVHPSGRWLLGSNRGDDSLVLFAVDPSTGALTLQGFTKTLGATPRAFAFDPAGTLLYVADQGPGRLVPFRFDVARGVLTPTGSAAGVPSASAVTLGTLHAAGP